MPGATRREDGSRLLDGLMPVAELQARLAIRELPDEDRGRYNTVAGCRWPCRQFAGDRGTH